MRLLFWFGKKDPGAGVAWGSDRCVCCVGEDVGCPQCCAAGMLRVMASSVHPMAAHPVWGPAESSSGWAVSARVCCVSALLPWLWKGVERGWVGTKELFLLQALLVLLHLRDEWCLLWSLFGFWMQ